MILLYDTGARVQELVDLRVTDFHLDAGTAFVLVTGKGNKTRSVPLMDKPRVVIDAGEQEGLAQLAAADHPWTVHTVGLPQVVGQLDLEAAPILRADAFAV